MTDPKAELKKVVIHYSIWERLFCGFCAAIVPVIVPLGLMLSEDKPEIEHWVALALFGAFFLFLLFISFRFEFRVDEAEIYHRELVTRRIPLGAVTKIRVARETKAGLISRIKLEVLGRNARIMVGYRASKMMPALRVLAERFPGKVEEVDSLPDA